jgi:hypothetical protein
MAGLQKTIAASRFLLIVILVAIPLLTPAWGFGRKDDLTLPYNSIVFSTGVIDPTHGFAYFSGGSVPDNIARIRLADFSYVSNLTLVNSYSSTAALVDTLGGYAYFASDQPSIARVRLSDFSRQGSLTVPLQGHFGCYNGGFSSAVIDGSAGFAYFGPSYSCSPPSIVKVSLSSFNVTATLVATSRPLTGLSSGVIDTVNGFAYFSIGSVSQLQGGTDQFRGPIIRVRLSDFTVDDNLTLSPGQYGASHAAVIDPAGGYAYFGVSSSNGGSPAVVRIRLSDFSFAGSVQLGDPPDSAVIDPSLGYAYFTTHITNPNPGPHPGSIVQIRLSDLTKTGTLQLNGDEGAIATSVADATSGYGYFETSSGYGDGHEKIVRVQLAGEGASSNAFNVFGLPLTATTLVIIVVGVAMAVVAGLVLVTRRRYHTKHLREVPTGGASLNE